MLGLDDEKKNCDTTERKDTKDQWLRKLVGEARKRKNVTGGIH